MPYYATGEVAKKLHVSVRTLRYYDQIDLVKPAQKKENGRRYYSEENVMTLEKICLLKNMQFSLYDIKKVLNDVTIEQLLQAHQQHLQDKIVQLQQSLADTTTLLNILKIEKKLNWEQILPLIRHVYPTEEKLARWRKYFSEEEKDTLQQRLPKMEKNDAHVNQSIHLIERVESCLRKNISPLSEKGERIALEALSYSEEIFQGDKALGEKFWQIRKSPDKAADIQLYPIKEEVLSFLETAIEAVDKK